jgi:two-component system LytT family response regulator
MKRQVLIADDEPPAREKLRAFLADEPDFAIAGEAADGNEAVELIQRLQPDVLFLDIEMPGIDGLHLVQGLSDQSLPLTVFTTAHARYAVDAYAANVTDYLLKPFDRDRFRAALTKIRGLLARPAQGPDEPGMRRLLVKSNGRYAVVHSDDIDWIEAAANYVVLHTASGNHVLRSTLGDILRQLGEKTFFRTGRSHAVCLNRICEVRVTDAGQHEIVLRSGASLRLQRDFRELQRQLEASRDRRPFTA